MIDKELIHNQCLSDDPKERIKAIKQLKDNFSSFPDKNQSWNDLIKLASDKDLDVKFEAAFALDSAYPQVPNKQKAWDDLHRLDNNKNKDIRHVIAYIIGSIFFDVPDKQQAWNDLHKFSKDKNFLVRSWTADAIDYAFSQVPDKQEAWDDLHRLTNDKNSDVRYYAASAIGSSFYQVPDKLQAWDDLHRLTNDKNSMVRSEAAFALDPIYYQLPNKQQALDDLHRLVSDKDSDVRSIAASVIGSAFFHMSDKQQCWNDLNTLTSDEDSSVKTYANYSLGRISIFKASQAEEEEDYKNELEKAIKFFEIAAQESHETWSNPAQFCLPFYRSFHTLIFKKQEAKREVDKYLAEAKDAIKGSKNKELLIEAVNNLSEALKEVQSLENLDFEAKKEELNSYRKHCDRAVKLMMDTEETAPFATAAMRKGLPILDRNLKGIIEEIRKKAKAACQESIGTPTQEIACNVDKEVQNWEMGSPEEMIQKVEDIAYVLKKKIGNVPENEYVLNKIEAMRHERNLIKQYEALLFVIEQIPTMRVIPEKDVKHQFEQQLKPIHNTFDSICNNTDFILNDITNIKNKLSCISFDISKIKLNSADVISSLKILKEELEKLNEIEGLNTLSIEKLNSSQIENLNCLKRDMLARFDEIKTLIDSLPETIDTQEFNNKLNQLKQSKPETLLQKSADILSIIGFAIQIYQQYGSV